MYVNLQNRDVSIEIYTDYCDYSYSKYRNNCWTDHFELFDETKPIDCWSKGRQNSLRESIYFFTCEGKLVMYYKCKLPHIFSLPYEVAMNGRIIR